MRALGAQTDCRFFSGYKPCGKNETCVPTCPYKQIGSPRILIVHLEALGAVLRATVVLRAIKRRWPQAHVTWITSPLASSLLENNPFIDRLLKNDHNGCLALSTLSFDYSFCVDKSLVAAGLLEVSRDSGIRRGFGVDSSTGSIVPLNEEAQGLYELGLSNHQKFHVNKKPETQLIIESLGLDSASDEYVFEFTQAETEFREKERIRLGLETGPVIGLNTGCSNVLRHKKLSVGGWVELIGVLSSKYPSAQFVLLGGPEDVGRNQEIAWLSDVGLKETPTQTGLRSGLVYVDLCDFVVTGDSLGLHMALALRKWVACWFGPSCLHEIDFYGRGRGVLTKAPCSPCWKRHCNKPTMCYDLVEWTEITAVLDEGMKLWRSQQGGVSWSSKPHTSATSSLRSPSLEPSDKI